METDPRSQRVLVCAPIGRDGPASAEILGRVGLDAAVCTGLDQLVAELDSGVGAAFVAEEALLGRDITDLLRWIDAQPPWADLPFILLTSHRQQAAAAWRLDIVQRLRNVTLVERPVQPISLTSTLQAALRSRRRQYDVRGFIEARERAAQELEAQVAARTAELKASNAQLRDEMAERARSEEQFRLLVQGVTDYAIYMLDPQGRISSWNAGAERIKGYAPLDIIGEHFSRFYTEEDRAAGLPAVSLETAARDGRFEKEGWRVRKDGTRFWANIVIDAIRDPAGTLTGFAKVTRDITERLKSQKQLEEAREALFQSQKLEAIGQLTGGIAHDFNNLLMVVLGSLALMRKRVPPEAAIVLPLLDNAVQAAQRGATLTKRMLAFARRQELKIMAVDIPELVRGMADLLQRSLGPSITIETRFPLGLPKASTDPNQLESALLNIAVNARDAMPEGGSITVAAKVESADEPMPGRYVCLSVTDTGEGMDPETLARATEPFFTTKGVGKGTGLGLSTVHGLMEQSHGRMVLASRKGIGTTIELWLPVASADADLSPAADEAPAPEAATPSSRLHIMAVDDDGLVLMNTIAMLEELGHAAVGATTADQALDALRREAADLVITDHAMPRMTGAELAGRIAAEWPGLPVILATGYAELPMGIGADLPKLAKPFSLEELEAAIRTAVSADTPVRPG
ncbi:MAG: ATP-binding protein [Inquilinus sp.]|uniref:ATP-binding protein n=1 Tax=Inquilinus sp. TaxID=1932117 RepID=UPI003F39D6CE